MCQHQLTQASEVRSVELEKKLQEHENNMRHYKQDIAGFDKKLVETTAALQVNYTTCVYVCVWYQHVCQIVVSSCMYVYLLGVETTSDTATSDTTPPDTTPAKSPGEY